MNKKRIVSILMTTFLVSGLASNVIVSATGENLEYTQTYVSEPISEVEVPKSEITATATSAQSGEGAEKAIDGDVDTLWHTPWSGVDVLNEPQSLTLDLGEERTVTSIHVTPRQSGSNGKIKEYKIYSGDTVIAEGEWESDSLVKVVSLNEPIVTDSIRIEALSSYGSGVNEFVSIAEVSVYQLAEAPNKLVDSGNGVISTNNGMDLNGDLDSIKNLEEGTAIIRFTESGDSVQSLFSISNNTRNNEHFHLYINGNQIGYELRKNSGDVSVGKVTVNLNPGINTAAFRAEKDSGYAIYLNGEKVLTVADDDAAFLSHLEDANTFNIGFTDRATGNEYPMIGTVDFLEIYDAPLADSYLREITGQTIKGDLPVPEGTFKSDPINLFEPGDLGSPNFRIPAMYTTKAGTVLASIDVRQGGGHDAPNNIDVGIIRSEDNGETWVDQQIILDYPGASSAIDTALLQDSETDRVFLIVTHFSEGYGFNQSLTSSGYEEIPVLDEDGEPVLDGEGNPVVNKYLIVIHAETNEEYTVREDGVIHDPEGDPTEYTVDEDQNLFKNGEENGHILTDEGDFKMIGTTFITLIYSDDDGRTWSDPIDLNEHAKEDWMRFFGTGPGRGHQITEGEYAGRLLFPIYVTNAIGFQSSACLYSDDNGDTWHFGETATDGRITNTGEVASAETMTTSMGLEQLTECQVVEMPNGQIKMFMRNTTSTVKVATSFDGGVTWDNTIETEEELPEPYCQLTVMNYSQQIDGKDAIIFANPAGGGRTGGTIRIGLIDEVGTHENGEPRYEFDWAYSQLIKEGVYQYSCLTELEDGNIGLFYEGTSNEEMSFTAMDTNYIKADLLASVPESEILSIESLDEVDEYVVGDTVNLKVTFNEAVSLIGNRELTLEVDGVEIPCAVDLISASEYKVTGVISADMDGGKHSITVKANENLQIINPFGKVTVLSEDIVTESNLVIEGETTKVFRYENLSIENGVGGDISEVVDDVKELEEGTIVIEFDNDGGEEFQSLLSFSNNNEDRERFYIFINDNDEIGLERQSSSGNKVVKKEGLTLNDGMNKIAVKVEAGIGYSIFVNGVKVITEEDTNAKFISGIVGLNSVNIGISDRVSHLKNPFTGEVALVELYSDIKSDEELIELTTEEEVVVDKAQLQSLINSVAELNEEIYTEVSWNALQLALTIANNTINNEDVSQEAVDAAKVALQAAIDGLIEASSLVLTVENEVNVGDVTNLKIAIDNIQEDYEAHSAEVTLRYEEAIFDLGSITSIDENYIVMAGESVDGNVEILVSGKGQPIISGENIINVELTAKEKVESSPIAVSGNISDGNTSREVLNEVTTVKVVDSVVEELHTGALEIAVEMAKDITEEDLEDVVPIVLENFKLALKEAESLLEAIKAGEAVTQAEINSAFDNLAESMHMLEHKGNREELLGLVESLDELNSEDYTNESWTNLEAVLNGDLVQGILDNENSLAADIEIAYNALMEAFSNLEEATEEVDKARLQAYVNELKELDESKYKPSTWEKFEEALTRAEVILEDENSSQEEVDNSYVELIRAELGLRLIPDKSLLEELINKVEELNKADYTKESWEKLSFAFANAKLLLDDDEATEEDVEKSEEMLQKSINELVLNEENPENETEKPETEDPEVETEKPESEDDEEKLPQTGNTSAVTIGLFGTIIAAAGAFILRKKQK